MILMRASLAHEYSEFIFFGKLRTRVVARRERRAKSLIRCRRSCDRTEDAEQTENEDCE